MAQFNFDFSYSYSSLTCETLTVTDISNWDINDNHVNLTSDVTRLVELRDIYGNLIDSKNIPFGSSNVVFTLTLSSLAFLYLSIAVFANSNTLGYGLGKGGVVPCAA